MSGYLPAFGTILAGATTYKAAEVVSEGAEVVKEHVSQVAMVSGARVEEAVDAVAEEAKRSVQFTGSLVRGLVLLMALVRRGRLWIFAPYLIAVAIWGLISLPG